MKTLLKIQTGVVLSAIFVIFSLSGCNNAGSQKKQAKTTVPDSNKKEIALSPESQKLLANFPTPFEITSMLQKAEAGFIFDITNPPANVNKYTTEKSKALNLGVYSADLSYSTTYNIIDGTNKFLDCTNNLADKLGIGGIYNQMIFEKIKKNNNNKDSLITLVNNVFSQTNDFLSKNNRNQIAVLVTAGGFAESLFIAASLAEFAKDNSKILAVIAGQKNNYMNLLSILGGYSADQTMKPVADELAKLKPIWGNENSDPAKKMAQLGAKEIKAIAESTRMAFTK